MARPTSRVLHLLELLQSAGTRTVGELAERLGVDERTVRRYVEHLLELGIPVEAIRGRYGGYRIAPGYRMAPLMLSDDEAVAVLLGLLQARAGSAARAFDAGAADTAAETAIAKIRRALPPVSAHRVDALLDAAVFAPTAEAPIPDASVLLTVADAVRSRRPLALRYRSVDGAPSGRTVHPYDLVAHRGRWYLVALDLERQAERTFRLDRIRSARPLHGSFPSRPDHDPVAQLIERFANAAYEYRVTLRIQATAERIRAHLAPSVAVLQRIPGDDADAGELPWHRAEIHAAQLDWIPSVIAALGCPVVIEGPEELRTLVRQVAERLAAAAER